ncbi:MAG: ROK family protein [Chloroflexi bacterium]|nr:ROK family protein [Chloroflexota bacterium]
MESETVLACDVGGTNLRAALVRADGEVLDKRSRPTPPDDPQALTLMMREVLATGAEVSAAVVGMPGPVDYLKGEVLDLPNLPRWKGHVTAARMSDEVGLPVLLANDADLATLGEHRFGAGKGFRDMVYITSSTGVGAGVILGNRLVHGAWSLAEIGHTIIDRATLETVERLGSGTALRRLSGEEASFVASRAESGDQDAARQFAAVAEDFAIGVFNMVHCFSPEVVVVGGGMSQAGDLLLGPVRKLLSECPRAGFCRRTRVVRAEGGDDVGLKGAAAFLSDSR